MMHVANIAECDPHGSMTFGEKLTKMIAQTGKTQTSLSRLTGIAQSAISEMSSEKRRPYLDQAFPLARALGVPLEFMADTEQTEPPTKEEMSYDEKALLDLFRALKLDKHEAMRRLATPSEGEPRVEPLKAPKTSKPGRGARKRPSA